MATVAPPNPETCSQCATDREVGDDSVVCDFYEETETDPEKMGQACGECWHVERCHDDTWGEN